MRKERLVLRNQIATIIRTRHLALIEAMCVSREAIYDVYVNFNPTINTLKSTLAKTYGYKDLGLMDYEHSMKAMDGMFGRN